MFPLYFHVTPRKCVGLGWGYCKGDVMTLTAAKAKSIRERGRYGDGRGLYLTVSPGGSKAWMLRIAIDGRRRDVGLGVYPTISLAKARQLADAHRLAVAEGRDPLAEKRRAKMPTFAEAAAKVHEANLPRWKNGKHTKQWLATLELYAFPTIGALGVDRIERRDVLAVLTPIWASKPETARRVRQRIRTVLKWAQVHDFVEHNAAGEGIDGALPAMPRLRAHFRALAYAEVPAALETVEASPASMAAKACLRFLVLTAARSGEARGATWAEIDLEAREWRIPAERMKGGVEHRVPLSDAALAVLTVAARLRDESGGVVFPSPRKHGRPLSDMALTKLLRDCGLADRATTHGFRSGFRDWAAECTNASHAAMELSLAHAVGSAVEQAYARSDLFERRRRLMDAWAAFLIRETAEVVQLRRRDG